jgi:hypothetical protein
MAQYETAAVVGATAAGLMVQRYSGRPRRARRAARRRWAVGRVISRKRRTLGTVSGYPKKLVVAADLRSGG